jgi:predicted Zn-ribbon and HTH transcriptional regulator
MREGSDTSVVTTRKEIADFIKERPSTAKDISKAVGVSEKEAYFHLEHIDRSYGSALKVVLPECRKCGFVFSKKNGKPSKCPECHSTWISDPEYYIK